MSSPSVDDIASLIERAGFSQEDRLYATREQCGTFALALYDELRERGIESCFMAIGTEPSWETDTSPLPRPLPFRVPNRLKRSHFNHVAVFYNGIFFDAEGPHTKAWLAEHYSAFGAVVLDRQRLFSKMGLSDRMPLYYDQEFYKSARSRLSRAAETQFSS